MTDSPASTLKALLFDLDGTLADTEGGGHRPAYNAAFRDLGLPWAWGPALYRRLLGQPGGRERVKHYAEHYDGEQGRSDADVDALVDQVHRAKSAHYKARLEAGKVRLRPGVRRLIKEASAAGIRVGIVTNGSMASVEAFLAHCLPAELRQAVALVVSPERFDNTVKKKPHPDLYLKALSELQLQADEVIAIEDSPIGARGAVAAGIRTIVTTNRDTRDYAKTGEFSGAQLVLTGLGTPDQPAKVLSSNYAGLAVGAAAVIGLDALGGL